jgi:hypothetical protein
MGKRIAFSVRCTQARRFRRSDTPSVRGRFSRTVPKSPGAVSITLWLCQGRPFPFAAHVF